MENRFSVNYFRLFEILFLLIIIKIRFPSQLDTTKCILHMCCVCVPASALGFVSKASIVFVNVCFTVVLCGVLLLVEPER